MKNIPLRIKIILGWGIIVLVPLAIIGTVFFVYISSSMERMSIEKSERIAENLAGMVTSLLQGELKTISSLAADPLVIEAASSGNFNGSLERKLKSVYARIGSEYEGVFVTDRNGVIHADAVDRKRLGIDVGNRDYFHRARRGIASIGEPIFSKATGLPIVVACAPIFDGNQAFSGVVASTWKIDLLTNRVAAVTIGKTGYAFLLNGKGIMIAHPSKEIILEEKAGTLPGVEQLTRRMIRQETGTEYYSFRNTEKVASFAPVDVTGWSVGITQDKSEFLESINAFRDFYLLAGGIFLLLTTAGIFYYSKNISTPIQKTLSTLNKAIEQSEEVFAIIGLDRKIQFVNPAMERITGCSASELAGQEPLLNNVKNNSREEIWQVLDSGNVWSGCVFGTNTVGMPFNLEVTITPIRDEKDLIGNYLEIGRDITRELRLEAQLRQGQKMEAIGTLAGGIAHDFNNILSAIYGYAELALTPSAEPSKTSYYVQGILTAAGRARDLVGQILTFSRQAEQESRPLEPGHLIKEALKLLRASLPATIEIQEEINSSSLMSGDPTQLHQVVMNLCTNAAHAMRENGGVLKIRLEEAIIDEGFARFLPDLITGTYLQLKVSDTGHGMPPEIRERIFDPFFTTKPKGEGTGLGLSVVHGIVKSFRGAISVSSVPGKGTEFTLYFPVIRNAGPHPTRIGINPLPRGNERIMVVDDEVDIADIEKEMLENLGYAVHVFNESTTALDHFRKSPSAFDVVITDYTMPLMTGLDLIGQMKKLRSDIPVVLCSGYFDRSLERHIGKLDRVERLNKPITSLELALAVRRAVEIQARG